MTKRKAFEEMGGIGQRGKQLRDAALANAHIGSAVALEDNDSADSARPTLDSESVFTCCKRGLREHVFNRSAERSIAITQ